MEFLHAILEMPHIFGRDPASVLPQALGLRSEDHAAGPLDVQIAVVERLRNLNLSIFADEEAQESFNWHCALAGVPDRPVVVPKEEPLTLNDVPQRER